MVGGDGVVERERKKKWVVSAEVVER